MPLKSGIVKVEELILWYFIWGTGLDRPMGSVLSLLPSNPASGSAQSVMHRETSLGLQRMTRISPIMFSA